MGKPPHELQSHEYTTVFVTREQFDTLSRLQSSRMSGDTAYTLEEMQDDIRQILGDEKWAEWQAAWPPIVRLTVLDE